MGEILTAERINVILHKEVIKQEILGKWQGISKEEIDFWLNRGYDIRPYVHLSMNYRELIYRWLELGQEVPKEIPTFREFCKQIEEIQGEELIFHTKYY